MMDCICVTSWPFAHADNSIILRRNEAFTQRGDNFYNGYNTWCQMKRSVCCNPFPPKKCCRYCCGNN